MDIKSFFANPSLWGIGLAILFGLFWLAILGAWRWRGKWILLVLAGAAVYAPAIAWIQAPLQNLLGNWLIKQIGQETFVTWLLLAGIPLILITAVVSEGAKMLPVFVYWLFRRKTMTPAQGLAVGAIAGAGFAVFESQWLLNSNFAAGFAWSMVSQYGVPALSGFIERFFTTAFLIATASLVGYGLAKGRGWQFYVLVTGLHLLLTYSALFIYQGLMTTIQRDLIVAFIAIITFGVILWLSWQSREVNKPPVSPVNDSNGSSTLLG
jgi:RsiW-degrading membrane proteinase PrsW (M82 family)